VRELVSYFSKNLQIPVCLLANKPQRKGEHSLRSEIGDKGIAPKELFLDVTIQPTGPDEEKSNQVDESLIQACASNDRETAVALRIQLSPERDVSLG
jgi:hypothetical protein